MECVDFNDVPVRNKHFVVSSIKDLLDNVKAQEIIDFIKETGFYRTARMHSADYAVARCPSVCLPVRLSARHTPVLSLNGYTYLQSFFTVG